MHARRKVARRSHPTAGITPPVACVIRA
jgi:hypothetical protein